MDSAVDDLVQLVGAPPHPAGSAPVDDPRWSAIEYRLDLEFPPDYKQLIAAFGTSTWGGFLNVLNPFSRLDALHLERAGYRMLGTVHGVRRQEPEAVPYGVFPEKCGLFPWAITDNGDALFWLTEGPSSWWSTVILEARGPECERHALTASAVIYEFLRAKLQSPLLLDPFRGNCPPTRWRNPESQSTG